MLTTETQNTLKSLIDQQQLTVVFQPIYHLSSGETLGYEALIRGPMDSTLYSPKSLFAEAEKQQLTTELELACRQKSIEVFASLDCGSLLFLNVNPQIFIAQDAPQRLTLNWLQQYGVNSERVVLEISEIYPFPDSKLVNMTLAELRQAGIKIALDDIGTGYSGPRAWAELEPDYIKIDRYFNSGIHKDKNKRKFLKAASLLASELGTQIICEGIEETNELEQIVNSGVNYGQGFLLNKPHQDLLGEPAIALKQTNPIELETLTNLKVGVLLKECITVDDKTTAGQLAEIFYQNPSLLSMPVVVDKIPQGLVWRSNLLEKFSTPFGRALHETKPVTRHLAEGTVIVDVDTPLDQVSSKITDAKDERLPWHFIICKNGEYLGVGSVRDLLGEITKQQISYASYANPLSLLPGNVPINQQVNALLQKKINFHLAYFDLNNFKPYNDVYGYAQGDKVIQFLANILKAHIKPPNFLGHIGGDDFVAIFCNDNWEAICQDIITEFDRQIFNHYEPSHVDEGGITTKDREVKQRFYPLLSLAIGVVNPDKEKGLSHHRVAEMASEAKQKAKQAQSSFLYKSV